MNRKFLAFACIGLISLAIAGCKPQEPAEPVEPAATPADTTAAAVQPDPQRVPDDSGFQPDASSIDTGTLDPAAFAGTFTGTLPCASCPGIDIRLDIGGDGRYRLSETYQHETDAPVESDGTWTAEADGKRIRLDPSSKNDDDRLYQVVSNDELRMLGEDGAPIEGELNYSLQRAD